MSSEFSAPTESEITSISENPKTKLPPQSEEAEQSLLGALLLSNDTFDLVSTIVTEDDFYFSNHKIIWEHIRKLRSLDRSVDVITVYTALKNSGKDEEVGGLEYIQNLSFNTPSSSNAVRYAEIVREKSILRNLIEASESTIDDSYHPHGKEATEILVEAEGRILNIAQHINNKTTDFKNIDDVLCDVLEEVEVLSTRTDKSIVTGLKTGFADLDSKTTGLHPGQLIIIAGRPAMGKTSLAMNIVENVAINEKKPVAVFSMEMDSSQLVQRMLGSIARVDHLKIRTGNLRAEDWPKITDAAKKLADAKVFIDESPVLNPLDIRSRARRLLAREGSLGLIMVDYLQLMSGSTKRSDNRVAEISEISRSLKQLAREMECPILALSQLNRSLEHRSDKRPIMSDLRESGAIEQDADTILFIYRDEVYNPDSLDKGLAELIIGKQRAGPIGTIKLAFQKDITKFENAITNPNYNTL
ncbi:replicative DNA helicase [Taylorella equigenitalis]|uniref:replicative DNA helicase n=1 Tax=Taylorella equigenitalis TaxID=29575 RepID=UPI00041F1A6E|nr:replicative DNA helicase [Taylorella equigenitalis]WDU52944.1 replicative DNA helicase [Taylorella equigenitalis]